jgi:uncharacterized membrane protein YbhN (UPF0104 family)
MTISSKIKNIIQIIFLIMIFGIGYRFFQNNLQEIELIKQINITNIFIISLSVFVSIIIASLPNKLLLEHFKINLKIKEWLPLFTYTYLLNYLPMRAGLFGKGIYLKEKYNLDYNKYISMNGGIYLINFSLKSLVVFFLSIFLMIQNQMNYEIAFFLLVIILIPIIIFYFSNYINLKKIKYLNNLSLIFHWLKSIKDNKKLIFNMIFLFIFDVLVTSYRYLYICKVFEYDVTIFESIIITTIASLSSIISITPGNIGIYEFFTGLGVLVTGGNMNNGIIVSSLFRVFMLSCNTVISLVFLLFYKKSLYEVK